MAKVLDGPVRIPSQDWLRDQSIAFIDTTNSIGATIIGSVSRDLIATRYAKFIYGQTAIIQTQGWLYEQTSAFLETLHSPEFNRADLFHLSYVTQGWTDHIYNIAAQRQYLESLKAQQEAY